ncbi:hypothetical protein D3C79_888510 [compost metagenome]
MWLTLYQRYAAVPILRLCCLNIAAFLPVDIQIEITVTGLGIGQTDPFPLTQRYQFVLVAQQFPLPNEFAKALNKPR